MRPQNDYCPRCSKFIRNGETRGESSIYGSHDIPDLCEPCFFDEDEEIEEAGTNDLPKTLAWYRENMRALA
jgi:hypothetical protein